jgi:beta-N-acetylhexosaminidase
MSDELDRAAAGCLLPGFAGVDPPAWITRWIERGLGGVVLFARNIEGPEQASSLTDAFRRERETVLVATDEEGGDVTRLECADGSSYPGNWALGVVDDVTLTAAVARAIADDLAAVGINLDFAPVADVNSNPDNPVIGIRAFGADAELVSRHVAAFIPAMQERRVAACAKHFPGHGDTSQDSHLELPVAAGSPNEALAPFRAAIQAGVKSVMTAHVRVPALDDEQATLSPRIMRELLREELGFSGVAITDALEMKAVSATVGVEEGAIRALSAGADLLCLGADVEERFVSRVHEAVVGAVRGGRLPEARLREAAGRVAELGSWASPSPGEAGSREPGAEAARRAIRVEGDIEARGPAVVVELRPPPSMAAGEAHHGLGDVLRVDSVSLSKAPADLDGLVDGRTPIVVVRDAHRYAWERNLVDALVEKTPATIVVEVGLPVWRPRGPAAYIATHGAGRANLAAAAELLDPASADASKPD